METEAARHPNASAAPRRGARPPTNTPPVSLALLMGAFGAVGTYLSMWRLQQTSPHDRMGEDFTFWWRAAQALLSGDNPYLTVRDAGVLPYDAVFAYPLPAAIAALPFAPIANPKVGAALFVGLGFLLATIALARLGRWRLPVLISAPAFWLFDNGQWAPYLIAGALIPWLGWLLAVKPTIGLALFAWRPRWQTAAGCILISAIGLLWLPSWPVDWIQTARGYGERGQYVAPLALPGGVLLLLALLRWRRPEGRLLFVLALVPQNYFFYDQLPLLLVPASQMPLLAFALWTHLLRGLAFVLLPSTLSFEYLTSDSVRSAWLAPFVLWGMYVPCLLMVLRRRNEGSAPDLVERVLSRLSIPQFLKGERSKSP